MSVSFLAIGWGGFMLLWTARKRRKEHITPVLLFMDVLGWALFGLWFGIVSTFGGRAFHRLLILATVLTFGCGMAVFIEATDNRKTSTE
jgi:hypothetical protein